MTACDAVYRSDQQVGILEDTQCPDVPHNAQDQQSFGDAFFLSLLQGSHSQSTQVVEQNGSDHQPNVDRFAPRIKKQAGCQQPQVAQRPRAQVVHPDHNGEKQK